MRFRRGDHICVLYSTTSELARVVADFLADGLRRGERCWYIASGSETNAIRAALRRARVDVRAETARGALKLVSEDDAYTVHGAFNPENTIKIFNDAIEQAYTDGFAGFRAAAEMSWALRGQDGAYQLIEYEALLRSLFATCRVIGLCLYDRERMPLAVINGALATHPVAASCGQYVANPFYDSKTQRLSAVTDDDVLEKLEQLDRRGPHPKRTGSGA
jgi:hypothetical protein